MLEFEEIVAAEVNDRRAAGAAVDLSVWDDTGKTVLGDRVALRRIVANLIDNALKYGQVARLSFYCSTPKGSQLLLLVDDAGPGIPPSTATAVRAVRPARRRRATAAPAVPVSVLRSSTASSKRMADKSSIADAPEGGARISVKLPGFAGRFGCSLRLSQDCRKSPAWCGVSTTRILEIDLQND